MSTDTGPVLFEQRLGDVYRARLRDHGPRDHPDEAAWEAFASGAMTREARLRLADHVVSCERCREVYEAVRVLMEEAPGVNHDFRTVARVLISPAWWRQHAPSLALAATLGVAVAAAALYVSNRPGEPAGVTTGDAPPVAAPPPEAAAPAPPVFRLALVKPDVELPADLIVTSRGASGAGARRFLERFGEAIAPYREGRFEEAAARLEGLTAAHGDVPEVWFYLGVSRLFAGRAADALEALDQPGVAAAAGDDLMWQRAVALERLGRTQESEAVLRALCARAGRYRDQACGTVGASDARPSPR
jgi:hypothetical protein